MADTSVKQVTKCPPPLPTWSSQSWFLWCYSSICSGRESLGISSTDLHWPDAFSHPMTSVKAVKEKTDHFRYRTKENQLTHSSSSTRLKEGYIKSSINFNFAYDVVVLLSMISNIPYNHFTLIM